MKSIFVKPGHDQWPRQNGSDSLDDPCDLILIGKPAGLMFGVDQIFVDMHIEDPSAASDQFHIDIMKDVFQFSFQTGSLWQVVSLNTVFDSYFHFSPCDQIVTQLLVMKNQAIKRSRHGVGSPL